MKNSAFTFLFCFFSLFTFSQNRSGYIGKKNMISVFTTSNLMAFNFINDFIYGNGIPYYVKFKKDNTKKSRVQLFRVDYRFSYQRILSNRFSIGLEFGHEKVKLNSTIFYYSNYGNFNDYSSPVYNANSFLLTAEFFNEFKVAGQGFSTGFGIGPKLYSFNTKKNYRFDENTSINIDGIDSKLSYIGINAYFQMTYRHPITSFLSFEVGLRFHSGYVLRKNYNESLTNSPLWSELQMYKEIRKLNLLNYASFKSGFVITL